MKIDIEEKTKQAFAFLAIELGIDISSARECFLLSRAIMYADAYNYYDQPTTNEENATKQIFLIRATSYFRRKALNPFENDNLKIINSIRNHEEYSVLNLKMRHQTPFKW